MSSKMWALMLLSLLALALPSKAHAICYCTCTTASGSTCTVSIPDLACNGTGNSRCTRPTEPSDMIVASRSHGLPPAARCGAAVFAIDPRLD